MVRLFVIILLLIFIIYFKNYGIFYNYVLCVKNPVDLLSKGYLNKKLFYYYGDIKIQELSWRIQFLLDNFDKIDLKAVKYLQQDLNVVKSNPYNSFHHPHFLIELKNNIDSFNNFNINFQMSTKFKLNFEKLADSDLNMNRKKTQYISPHIRVYATDMVQFVENEYFNVDEFINQNRKCINDYVFKNLEEYNNIEILKK
jgi:hypothetical protein